MLYAAVGDATRGSHAQNPDSPNGKILRMTPDGTVAAQQPVRGIARLVARPPQRPGLRLGPRGPPVGHRVRRQALRRGQPHRQGRQLRLAGGRGPRRHPRRHIHQPGADLVADLDGLPAGAAVAGGTALRRRPPVLLPVPHPDPRRRPWAPRASSSATATAASAPWPPRPTAASGSRRRTATAAATRPAPTTAYCACGSRRFATRVDCSIIG